MDIWMDLDFIFFSTVFQSNQKDGRLIMKGCVQWNPVYCWKDSRPQQSLNQGPPDQLTRASATELPQLLGIEDKSEIIFI